MEGKYEFQFYYSTITTMRDGGCHQGNPGFQFYYSTITTMYLSI